MYHIKAAVADQENQKASREAKKKGKGKKRKAADGDGGCWGMFNE